MSHLRQDPLTGRWVIMSSGRRNRPNEYPLRKDEGALPTDCPFCPGREAMTTNEVLALGRPDGAPADSPGWRLRVFPNLYPALTPTGTDDSFDGPVGLGEFPELFVQDPGVGAHEIIAYSPDHRASLGTLPTEDLAELLMVLQRRYAALAENPKHRYILQFVNHGAEAGATLSHPHLQILATPMVPAVVSEKLERMDRHRIEPGRCLVCDLLAAEKSNGDRVIAENGGWTALAPWASRFPWEMILIPRRHQGSILAAASEELSQLADLLGEVLGRLDALHGNPPLNVIFHGAPLVIGDRNEYFAEGPAAPDGFHWHVEICPRLARLAGFETGTGFAINSVFPEEAARRLRGEDG